MNILRQTLLFLFCFFSLFSYSQVGIGTDAPKGALDVSSTNLGLVVPRVSSYADVTTPSGGSPVDGTMAYDTTLNQLILYIDGKWIAIGQNASGSSGAFSVPGSFTNTQIGNEIVGQPASGGFGSESFGKHLSISADGSVIAIGAPGNDTNGNSSGNVRVFEDISGVWTQKGNTINGASVDQLGSSVSISDDGNIVAIGAIQSVSSANNSPGYVRVYEYMSGNGSWQQIGSTIVGEGGSDDFGHSVSISSDGTIVAAGAINNDGNGSNSGHVRVYENLSGTWTKIGADINGEAASDNFGWSVSLSSDGNIVAIGGQANDGNGSNSGQVRVYENLSGTWTQIGADIDGEFAQDRFGYSVSISADGSILAAGAYLNDGVGDSGGHVRIFQNISGVWTQIGANIDGEFPGDNSGISVSLSDDGATVAIGAINNDGSGSNSGHARIYKNESGVWVQSGSDIDGAADGDQAGYVSLSANGLVVALGATGYGTSGHVRVFK